MKIFLSPHNDDETLFGAFTLLRERPHVIVCLRSMTQANRGTGITFQQREAETAAAMKVLGCTWEQWDVPDDNPDWEEVSRRIRALDASAIWSPALEDGGHEHHNRIGAIALAEWFDGGVQQYLTYTKAGKSSGTPVEYQPEWIHRKLQALACYKSQILEQSCAEHFIRDQREYYA